VVAAADEAASWSSQYFVQTLTRMADSSRAKVKEVTDNHQLVVHTRHSCTVYHGIFVRCLHEAIVAAIDRATDCRVDRLV